LNVTELEPTYGPYVPPEGRADARIVFIGEAPGKDEVLQRRPFVGRSGDLLDFLIADSGGRREDCYITNVVKFRPPGNKFAFFRKKDNKPLLEASLASLEAEIKKVAPRVIICLGVESLKAIIGDGRIKARRGFVEWSNTYQCKVIATFHPAFALRDLSIYPICLFDIKKAFKELETPSITRTARNTRPVTNFDQAMALLGGIKDDQKIAFDIENTSEASTALALRPLRRRPSRFHS